MEKSILAVESTCDETSLALLKGRKIKKNLIYSQVKLHLKYKGVVPEVASRAHSEKLYSLLKKMGLKKEKIDYVAFSRGPGLNGSLIVSRVAAETLSALFNAPLIGINHLEGHFLSSEIEKNDIKDLIRFPAIALIASGGHSELWYISNYGKYRLLGATRDDAAGEAFDKVGKLMGLDYPAGPLMEKLAEGVKKNDLVFPVADVKNSYDFSFSGLKTAVAYHLKDRKIDKKEKAKIAAAFQRACVYALLNKSVQAVRKYKVKQFIVGGGVSANNFLRKIFEEKMAELSAEVLFPRKDYCTDNAAMIAVCAFRRIQAKKFKNFLKPESNLKIESWAL